MKSTFRDHLYFIIILAFLTLFLPLFNVLVALEGFNLYLFVDKFAAGLCWFGLLFYALTQSRIARIKFEKDRQMSVKSITSRLQRMNAKKMPVLDARDAHILLLMAEAAVLSGDETYGAAVAEHVRGDRRDLHLKHPIIRYDYARTMMVLALERRDHEEARRFLSSFTRAWNELSAYKKYVREGEKNCFVAMVKLLETNAPEDAQKLLAAVRACNIPVRHVEALWLLIRHYESVKDRQNADYYATILKDYSGDLRCMVDFGCRPTGSYTRIGFAYRRDVKGVFRSVLGGFSCLLGASIVWDIFISIRYGNMNEAAWVVLSGIAIVLGGFGLVRPVKNLAKTGILLGIAFFVFAATISFDFQVLSWDIRISPLEEAETISGVDLELDGSFLQASYGGEYTILQIQKIGFHYLSTTGETVDQNIMASGLFHTKTAVLRDYGEVIPQVVADMMQGNDCQYLLVNLTEKTVNALPTVSGPYMYLVIEYDDYYGIISFVKYIVID